MATDANTLLSETACYDCLSEAEWRMIQLGLLQQILLASDPMADTSANALLEAAKCYRCLGEAEWRMIELGLLKQIVAGGGTGGGGEVGVGSPEGVVTASPGTTYTDITDPDIPTFWVKTTGVGNTGWVQIIA